MKIKNVKGIKEVDKIFNKVDYSLETHIEQYEALINQFKGQEAIGIIISIDSAVQIKYDVTGFSEHTGSTPMKERRNAVDAVAIVGNKIENLVKNMKNTILEGQVK